MRSFRTSVSRLSDSVLARLNSLPPVAKKSFSLINEGTFSSIQVADALNEVPSVVLDICHQLVKEKRAVAGIGKM
jgi:hypothetical protein